MGSMWSNGVFFGGVHQWGFLGGVHNWGQCGVMCFFWGGPSMGFFGVYWGFFGGGVHKWFFWGGVHNWGPLGGVHNWGQFRIMGFCLGGGPQLGSMWGNGVYLGGSIIGVH